MVRKRVFLVHWDHVVLFIRQDRVLVKINIWLGGLELIVVSLPPIISLLAIKIFLWLALIVVEHPVGFLISGVELIGALSIVLRLLGRSKFCPTFIKVLLFIFMERLLRASVVRSESLFLCSISPRGEVVSAMEVLGFSERISGSAVRLIRVSSPLVGLLVSALNKVLDLSRLLLLLDLVLQVLLRPLEILREYQTFVLDFSLHFMLLLQLIDSLLFVEDFKMGDRLGQLGGQILNDLIFLLL